MKKFFLGFVLGLVAPTAYFYAEEKYQDYKSKKLLDKLEKEISELETEETELSKEEVLENEGEMEDLELPSWLNGKKTGEQTVEA